MVRFPELLRPSIPALSLLVLSVASCAGTGDPPEIDELRASATELSEGESVVVMATVTDPDGLDNVAGGKLVSEDGTVFFSPFEQLSNGTFATTLSWDQLNKAQPIEFTTIEKRTVVARFSDNDKNEASQPLTLSLTCRGLVACAGACVDVATDAANCGGCGQPCPSTDRCDQGSCLSNCEPCLQAQCSLELAVCATSSECTALRGCLSGCSDQGCADQCSATHAAGMSSYYDLYQCYVSHCEGYCGSRP